MESNVGTVNLWLSVRPENTFRYAKCHATVVLFWTYLNNWTVKTLLNKWHETSSDMQWLSFLHCVCNRNYRCMKLNHHFCFSLLCVKHECPIIRHTSLLVFICSWQAVWQLKCPRPHKTNGKRYSSISRNCKSSLPPPNINSCKLAG